MQSWLLSRFVCTKLGNSIAQVCCSISRSLRHKRLRFLLLETPWKIENGSKVRARIAFAYLISLSKESNSYRHKQTNTRSRSRLKTRIWDLKHLEQSDMFPERQGKHCKKREPIRKTAQTYIRIYVYVFISRINRSKII